MSILLSTIKHKTDEDQVDQENKRLSSSNRRAISLVDSGKATSEEKSDRSDILVISKSTLNEPIESEW